MYFFYNRKCDLNCIEENPASIIRNRVKCFLRGESYDKENEISKEIDTVNIHLNLCTYLFGIIISTIVDNISILFTDKVKYINA